MSHVDYYVLPDTGSDARLHFLYRLLDKIHPLGMRIYIRVHDETEARQLDQRLWEYRADAFLPHSLLTEGLEAPVEIGYGDSLPSHRAVYINMAGDIAPAAFAFERLIEIVIQQEQVLADTRANYRQYKQQGFTIRMNDMRRKPQ